VDKFSRLFTWNSPTYSQSWPVRRILQSIETRLYFHDGQWTPDPAQAQHFPDSGKVIEACLRYHLTDVDLVLQLNPETAGVYDTHIRLFDHALGA